MMPVCPQCARPFFCSSSRANRAAKINAPLYCGRKCAGQARRSRANVRDKKASKADYDRQRRAVLSKQIAEQKRRFYEANKARILEQMKAYRQKRMPFHVEYCRRPEYKKWKSTYDMRLREKEYGAFAEAWRLLLELDREIRSRATAYERRAANGYYIRSSIKARRQKWLNLKAANSPQSI